MNNKVKNIINSLIKENDGVGGFGMGADIVKHELDPLTKAITEFLADKFGKTKIVNISSNGDEWSIDLQSPINDKTAITGLQQREVGKVIAYDHRDQLRDFIEKKFNLTPLSISGLSADKSSVSFGIQFFKRNTAPDKMNESTFKGKVNKLVENLLK